MRRLLLLSVTAACFLAPLACDVEKTINQFTAENVLIGTLLSTPSVDISPTAAVGVDGGIYTSDGGEPMLTVPGQTVAFVFFGTRDGENSAPQGVSGATVTLQPTSGEALTLTSDGSGAYSRSIRSDDDWKYQSGSTYRFTVTSGGERFVGEVKDSPALERINEFHPAEGFVRHSSGQPLSFDRAAPPSGQERAIGFVTVFPLSENGQRGEPTYTNLPKAPLEFLQLVAFPAEWRQARVTIPGTAFPKPRQTYLVTFQAVRTGRPQTDNLFVGSALLAGTADIGVIRTQ